jgi:hypothetical protein
MFGWQFPLSQIPLHNKTDAPWLNIEALRKAGWLPPVRLMSLVEFYFVVRFGSNEYRG